MKLKDYLLAELDRLESKYHDLEFGTIIFEIKHNRSFSCDIKGTYKTPKNPELPLTEALKGDKMVEGKVYKV